MNYFEKKLLVHQARELFWCSCYRSRGDGTDKDDRAVRRIKSFAFGTVENQSGSWKDREREVCRTGIWFFF